MAFSSSLLTLEITKLECLQTYNLAFFVVNEYIFSYYIHFVILVIFVVTL